MRREPPTGSRSWSPKTEPRVPTASHRFGPALDFKARDLEVEGPQDEFDLALMLQNEANGQTLELWGPRVRVPERIWTMNPPTPKILGLVQMLNPSQEGGLFSTLGRAWKYRKCIEERKAAKTVPRPVHDARARRRWMRCSPSAVRSRSDPNMPSSTVA